MRKPKKSKMEPTVLGYRMDDVTFVPFEFRPPGHAERPFWHSFNMVDEEHEDVFVSTWSLDDYAVRMFEVAESVIRYDGFIPEIRDRTFVSLKAMILDKPELDGFRRFLLWNFQKCREGLPLEILEPESAERNRLRTSEKAKSPREAYKKHILRRYVP